MTGKEGRSLRKSLKLTQKVHTFHFLDLAHATLCKVLRSAPGVFQASRGGKRVFRPVFPFLATRFIPFYTLPTERQQASGLEWRAGA
jgi:hypothetical protein